MKKNFISVIIPNWNGLEYLKICLPSLLIQKLQNIEVIVVDNGSNDTSVSYIKKYFPTFRIVSLEKNYGFSKAVNEGIKIARGEFIFLLNNDTEVDKNSLRILLNTIEQKKVAFVVPKVLDFYKRDTLELAGSYFVIDVVGHLFSMCVGEKDNKKYNLPDYTFLAPGGAALFRKEIFQKIGLFDEDYFLYLEDADLSLRAQLAGFKGWYEPNAAVYHVKMATSKRLKSQIDCLVFRNMLITMIKDYPLKLFIKDLNWLKIILVHLNTLRFLLLKGYFFQALKVDWYILMHFKQLLRKRKAVQKLKVVSDQYIIDNIQKKKIKLPF